MGTFWNELYLSPVFDETGELVNFFASQVDVSASRQGEATGERVAAVERRLADAQRQLKITLTAAGVAGTWDWDIPGKLLHVDDRFALLNGIEQDVGAVGPSHRRLLQPRPSAGPVEGAPGGQRHPQRCRGIR